MKKLISFFTVALFLFLTINATAQNVNVNPGAGSYPTLKAAFDAINAGTHTGAVTIDIVGNTTEPVVATLNASGTGAASYSSVNIAPSGGAWTITGSDTVTIKLAGADNVIINGGGSARNLTILNTATGIASATAIWLAHGGFAANDSAGAQSNKIEYCNISAGVTQNTATTPTYGICIGGTTKGLVSGRNNINNSILANNITRCRIGIAITGSNVNLNHSNRVHSNTVGPTAFGPDQIGQSGIYVRFQNNCSILDNKVQFVGGYLANTTLGADRTGIGVGANSWATNTNSTTTGTNNLIERNIVHDIVDSRTFSAVGIICATTASGSATNNQINNNVIYNIISNGKSPDQGVGIGHIGSRGDKILYNSIYMTGNIDAGGTISPATQYSAGIKVADNSIDTALTISDNSIYMDITSANTSLLHYCIVIPSATYDWGSGTCNNNDYYFPPSNTQMRTGGLGALQPLTTSFLTLANWQTAFTPAQDGASIQADPLYANITLQPGTGSPLVNAGVPHFPFTQVDILGITRSLTTPTIGAYENTIQIPELSLTFNFEACPNQENVTVYLRGSAAPYAIVDSVNIIAGGNTVTQVPFTKTSAGTPYYVVVKGLNSLETWSATTVAFNAGAASYNFASSISQAYENNQILSGGIASFYQGDVTQDGFIDLSDVLIIQNEAELFITSLLTDLNCDGATNLTDVIIASNNSSNFVSVKKP